MSFNSQAYLTHAENIATGTVVVAGTYRRHKEIKPSWFNTLTDAQRQQLREEAEYEEQKRLYQQ